MPAKCWKSVCASWQNQSIAALSKPATCPKDEDIQAVADKAAETFGQVDILVHSIGFANREELSGPYYRTSRAGFHLAMDISVYSFHRPGTGLPATLAPGQRAAYPDLLRRRESRPGLQRDGRSQGSAGSLRCATWPMTLARRACASMPSLPDLSARWQRQGVSRFKDMYRHFSKLAPLQQHVTIEDVGNTAVFLCSDLAAQVTGEVLYVDSGYNIIGVPEPPECEYGRLNVP